MALSLLFCRRYYIPGIYLQTAGRSASRDEQEKFKAVSINISSSFVFERRFARRVTKKRINYLSLARYEIRSPITGRIISIENGSIRDPPRWRNNRKRGKITTAESRIDSQLACAFMRSDIRMYRPYIADYTAGTIETRNRSRAVKL